MQHTLQPVEFLTNSKHSIHVPCKHCPCVSRQGMWGRGCNEKYIHVGQIPKYFRTLWTVDHFEAHYTRSTVLKQVNIFIRLSSNGTTAMLLTLNNVIKP
jgi:hypothetical protein